VALHNACVLFISQRPSAFVFYFATRCAGMQVTLSSISDGIKSTSEENESLRGECIRLKEQLVDTLNRLQKSAEYNEKIVEVRAAENKLCVCCVCFQRVALLLVACQEICSRMLFVFFSFCLAYCLLTTASNSQL
jgi:hypothetical protein